MPVEQWTGKAVKGKKRIGPIKGHRVQQEFIANWCAQAVIHPRARIGTSILEIASVISKWIFEA
jgi:hypothetical protein